MSSETSQKVLSICMCGRDDDYMLDFPYRSATTVNQLARYLVDLGRSDDVEVVFTDWGSEIPLAKTLRLSKAAGELCRFIYVSPSIVAESQKGSNSFHTARAINTAIRWSCGRYVLVSNPDQLVTRTGLDALLRMLRGDIAIPADMTSSLMLVPRVQVPWQFVRRQPDLEEWERYLFYNEFALRRESTALQHCAGSSGGLMMRGDHYRSLRGLDERHSGWGWSDVDFGMRALQSHPVFWLSAIGMSMFHMGHAPSGRRHEGLATPNPPIWSITPQVNDDKWGMNQFAVNEMRCSKDTESSLLAQPTISPESVTKADFLKSSVIEGIRDTAARLMDRGCHITSERIHSMTLAAWYAFERFPRRCVFFGISEGVIASLVASACPNVEIYGIDRWEGVVEGNPAVRLANDFVYLGHQGRVHYLNGDPSTAIARLRKAYGDEFQADLVTLSETSAGLDASSAHLLLASGGAILIESVSTETLDSFWHATLRDRPDWSWTLVTCNRGKSALILNWRSTPGAPVVHKRLSLEFDVEWWDIMLKERSREKGVFWKILRKLFS